MAYGLTVASGDVIHVSQCPTYIKEKHASLSYSPPSTPCLLLKILFKLDLNKPFRPTPPKQKKSKPYKLVPSMLRRAIKRWPPTMASKCLTPTTGKINPFQFIHRYSISHSHHLTIPGWESLMGQQLVLLFLKISLQERKFIDLIMNVFLSGSFTRAVRLHMDTSKSSITVLPSTLMRLFWRIHLGRRLFSSGSALFKVLVEAL